MQSDAFGRLLSTAAQAVGDRAALNREKVPTVPARKRNSRLDWLECVIVCEDETATRGDQLECRRMVQNDNLVQVLNGFLLVLRPFGARLLPKPCYPQI
jgi:hypothetical protein